MEMKIAERVVVAGGRKCRANATIVRQLPIRLLRLPAGRDNAATQYDLPKRNRRWFQFSLRSLLNFTLICAVASAWVARRMEQKRKEREAVEPISKLGGQVIWTFESIDDRSLLVIDLRGTKVTGAELASLEWLPQLQTHYLGAVVIGDGSGLHHITHPTSGRQRRWVCPFPGGRRLGTGIRVHNCIRRRLRVPPT
jgi:hypothetical protein